MKSTQHNTFGFAHLVAMGIFLSRISGLIREHVFARYFGGASMAAGVFRASLRIPNFLQNLLGEGVLSASFIPVYARLLAEGDEKTAGRVAGAIASILTLFVGVMVVIGIALAPWLVSIIVPGFKGEARRLTIQIVRILFPGVGALVLSAWCLGVLNSHRKFFLSYVAPVLWNAVMIATMVALGSRMGSNSLAVALAWGTVAGSFLQFAVQAPFVFRYAKEIRFAFETSLPHVRIIVRNTLPAILSRGIVQVSAWVDQQIASFLRNGTGAVSILGYAQTLYLLPVSLFGMSVAAAELPQMSSATGSQEEVSANLRKRLAAGMRQIAFFIIPTAAGFILTGKELVAAIYQTGQFGKTDSAYVWYVLAGYAIGLPAVTRGRLFNSAFYALHDTATPLRFAIVRVALAAGLGYLFAFPLQSFIGWTIVDLLRLPAPRPEDMAMVFGSAGLTLSSGLSGWIEYILLCRTMEKRIGLVRIGSGFYIRLWGSALAAGALALAALHWIFPWLHEIIPTPASFKPALDGLGVVAVFGGMYSGIALALGIEEAKRLVRRILRIANRQ